MKHRLKILAVNWRDPLHPEAGGAEVHLDKLLSHLALNHHVTLVATKVKNMESSYFYHGYHIYRLGHPFFFHFTFKKLWNKIFKKQKFDIIIDDISKIGLQTPKFITDIPIVAIFHHVHGNTLYQLLYFPVSVYVFIIEKFALKSYTHTPMIVVSESTKSELLKLDHFNNISVLPNGVDPEYLKSHHINKIPYQLCSIGRLTAAKRIDQTLEVFAKVLMKFPQAKLIIAGKGSCESQLKLYSKRLCIDHAVDFRGYISEQEKINLLNSSMGFLFTSEKEGWGIVAIESSASRTPVFGYRVPGIVDSVQEGVNGYLVNFGDTTGLAESIALYFEKKINDQQKIQEMSYYFAKQYDWQNICQEFELFLYKQLKKTTV